MSDDNGSSFPSDLQTSSNLSPIEIIKANLHPVPADDGIQLLTIMDPHNIVSQVQKDLPQGTFGPIPMRTGYDKLLYGTGIAYLCG